MVIDCDDKWNVVLLTMQIKAESLAVRCEICHQADLYNPLINHCQRCNNILNEIKAKIKLTANQPIYFRTLSEIDNHPNLLQRLFVNVNDYFHAWKMELIQPDLPINASFASITKSTSISMSGKAIIVALIIIITIVAIFFSISLLAALAMVIFTLNLSALGLALILAAIIFGLMSIVVKLDQRL